MNNILPFERYPHLHYFQTLTRNEKLAYTTSFHLHERRHKSSFITSPSTITYLSETGDGGDIVTAATNASYALTLFRTCMHIAIRNTMRLSKAHNLGFKTYRGQERHDRTSIASIPGFSSGTDN
jgi:hypothetical protein